MKVQFNSSENGLAISFETNRLYLRSYTESDFEESVKIYGDKRITSYFDHGEPRSREEVKTLVNEIGLERFKRKDPLGLFTAFKKEDNTFVGHFDFLPYKEKPGAIEIGYIISHDCQKQGYGTEITEAIINIYAKAIQKRGDKINGSTLKSLEATVHKDNTGSKRILEKVGMTFMNTIEKEGWAPRLYYTMDI